MSGFDDLCGIPYKSKSELNRTDNQNFYLNGTENSVDYLEHALMTCQNSKTNLKWKWVSISLTHALYGFCIAALRRGSNTHVVDRGNDADKNTYIKLGTDVLWKKLIRKNRDNGYGFTITWEDTDFIPDVKFEAQAHRQLKVIGFWTALARVQDSVFYMPFSHMDNFTISLTESQWQAVDWLYNKVRNELLHFLPKEYAISIDLVKTSCLEVLNIIEQLITFCDRLLFSDDQKERALSAIQSLRIALTVR
ncbi:hypothetical protein JNL27_10785 [bacterium]|nr:hypothetical protein [bacterium]